MILSQISQYMSGGISPQLDTVFSTDKIDKKIDTAKAHIHHLQQSLCHRNTHGGKTFRSKNISIKEQISSHSERLELLKTARTESIRAQQNDAMDELYAIYTDPIIDKIFDDVLKQLNRIITDNKVQKIANDIFGSCFSPALSSGKETFWQGRKVTVLSAHNQFETVE